MTFSFLVASYGKSSVTNNMGLSLKNQGKKLSRSLVNEKNLYSKNIASK